MPQRIGRVTIHNTSGYLRLVHTVGHLCHGEWTEGLTPPDSIEPGNTATIQSESGGDIPIVGNLATGTEGYVKYDVIGPDRRHGMIYLYWDNPWFGRTLARGLSNADDVVPDCDVQGASGDSTFHQDPNLDYDLPLTSYTHVDGGGTITAPGDLVAAFAAGPVLGVASLFGLENIVKDPEWRVELRDVQPSFAPTEPSTYKLMTKAEPKDWVGDWRQDEITVSIRPGRTMSST